MKCVLKELIEYSKDGEWGKDQSFEESEEMLCIRGTDFESARFGSTEKVPRRFIAQRHADRKRLQPWDVLIEAAGGTKDQPTGRTVLLKPSVFRQASLPLTCASFSRLIRFRTDLCDPTFMFWYLQSLYHSDIMRAYHTQHTGVARFQWTTFAENEPLQIPDLPTQRKIAGILSAYDDLIENNLRRIKILEQMAQSLYREWLVHFRFPGHESAQFIESDIGRTPKGWDVKPVTEAVTVRPKVSIPKGGDIPFVTMGGLSENSMLITEVESRDAPTGARFQNGDTLFARITPCLENGKTGYVKFLPSDESAACGSTEFIVLRSKTVCPQYVYLMARSDAFRDNAIKSMSGATGRQRVRDECFDQFFLAQPPEDLLARFESITRPQFELIHSLNRRNQNLRRTRDLLLPKLLNPLS